MYNCYVMDFICILASLPGHLYLGCERERHRGQAEADCGRMEHAFAWFLQLQDPWGTPAERSRDLRDCISDGRQSNGSRLTPQQQVYIPLLILQALKFKKS